MSKKQHNVELVIISGVSGSGKSTALKAYEDIGYFCLDNLPAPLIEHFVQLLISQRDGEEPSVSEESLGGQIPRDRYALLVDCRDDKAVGQVRREIARLKEAGVQVTLLFLECREEVVATRFRQTRRPHPLLQSSSLIKTIAGALDRERLLLAELRAAADRIIDTSNYSPHELRRLIEEQAEHRHSLQLAIQTFGYKYGVPHDIDLLVDVRFLPNPHFIEALRPLSGTDRTVSDYVFSSEDAGQFVRRYLELLEFLIPRFKEEGKRYLTLAVGCTGGKHRSVAIGERFAEELRARGHEVMLSHRDIERA